MSFDFIRELSEARVFRRPTDVEPMKISQLADSLYTAMLGLQVLWYIDPSAAMRYAEKTLNGGNGWLSSGSDLHNMIHIMENPDKFSSRLKIDRLSYVPSLQLRAYLRRIANGREDVESNYKIFLILQKSLGVQSPGLKNARRIVLDWHRSTPSERQSVASRLYYALRHDIRETDFWPIISKGLKRSKLVQTDTSVDTGMPLWQKMAISGAAGYYLGSKTSSS